ncbi:MAG: acyltransferase family protein [Bacilli bacterium]|nr:acyltransferase family protein [Bacilli bacterium]
MLKNNKREIIYDYIRVFACVCVICIHSTDSLIKGGDYDNIWWLGITIQGIVRTGLPLFVLLSGVLALNQKEEKMNNYYFKKFIKIIIPLLIYSLIYIFIYDYDYNLSFFKISNLLNSFKNILSDDAYYHLWYGYMIIGIYICVPYLRKMCISLNDKESKNLLSLIFTIATIKYLLPSLGIEIGIKDFIFEGWLLIFLLGYFVNKDIILKHYKLIYLLGITSFIFYLIANRWFLQIKNLNDLSITMMFQVMAIYIFFYQNKEKICKNRLINKIIVFLSKYSWEIFLIHAYILDTLRYMFNLWNVRNIITIILLSILTYGMSLLFAYVIHNLITNNIQKLVKFLTTHALKIYQEHIKNT